MKIFNSKVLLVSLSLCLMFLSNVMVYSSSLVERGKIMSEIDPLLISQEYEFEIISVSEPLNNIMAVFLDPPYRDFPNVIFFVYKKDSGELNRVYEALSIGIQDGPSDKIDLHTLGLGVDVRISEEPNDFNKESVKRFIELGNIQGFDVIPYQDFIHMHGPNGEFYTIDKTKYRDFAIKLIGDVYNEYPKDKCVMYDTPDLTDATFTCDNGKYKVVCATDNNQVWTVSFEGVDLENRYLVKKEIEVKKL